MRYANRLQHIQAFRVVEVLTRARALEAQGMKILHLEAGEPDFPTAEPIIQAGQEALRQGRTGYTEGGGIPALREALSEYYAGEYGLEISARRILITPGASGALLLLIALLVDPGRQMLITDPGYPCNRNFLAVLNACARLVPVSAAERYQLHAQHVGRHWSESVVGALAASPANPTGEMLSAAELRDLWKALKRRGGFLISDEIYHGLCYENRASSALEFSGETFVIGSFSKYFGMTGWRVGWLVAPEDAVPELEKISQNLFISVSSIAQYAALAAFLPQTREILDQRRDLFARRRDFLLRELQNLGFGIPHKPAGAMYLYADISRFSQDSDAFCRQLLEEHGVALVPGTDFGVHGAERHVRFSYATGMEQLEQAVELLARLTADA